MRVKRNQLLAETDLSTFVIPELFPLLLLLLPLLLLCIGSIVVCLGKMVVSQPQQV